MSFFYKSHTIKYKKNQRSLQTKITKRIIPISKNSMKVKFNLCKERTFCFASFLRSKYCHAAMTVEAALILPLFLLAMVSVAQLMQMIYIQEKVQFALTQAVRNFSVEAHNKQLNETALYAQILTEFGLGQISWDQIRGGMAGINYSGTKYQTDTGEVDIVVSYYLQQPFKLFLIPPMKVQHQLSMRVWIGGKLFQSAADGDGGGQTVYVAENGVVYHIQRDCAYIDLSIHAIMSGLLSTLRNSGGGKYYACELCGARTSTDVVFITDNGDRYHTDAQCSGIKRMIHEEKMDACALPACSKCSK